MSYLDRLKQLEIFTIPPGPLPTKPTKWGFDGFDGSPLGTHGNIFSDFEVAETGNESDLIFKEGHRTLPTKQTKASAELTRLVRLCGERYGFTEQEQGEALAAALADFDAALMCYRSIAERLGEQ